VAILLLSATYLILRAPDPSFLLESNDQGYQMALGMALATGRIPCFDQLTQYGPLVSVLSWFGFFLTGSAVGELCIDAFGYAAAIALAYKILREEGYRTLAMLAVVTLLALFPRFYKWYYWLLPLIGVSMALRFRAAVVAHRSTVGLLAVWGGLVGTSWLFRYDLGLEGMVFGLLTIIAAQSVPRAGWHMRAVSRDALWFLLMCALFPGALLSLIALARGHEQLALFLLSIRDGATDSVLAYGIRPLAFNLSEPTSAANMLALSQLAFMAVYAVALPVALREFASGRGAPQREAGYRLLCIVLTGLGVLPQALHRADVQHLLQVLPPLVLVIASLSARCVGRGRLGWQGRSLSLAVCAVTALLLCAIVPRASVDLASAWRNPVTYWRTIADLPRSRLGEPVADMAMAILRLTPPQSSIFLLMSTSKMPLLFFSRRHQAGLFPVYEVGMFTSRVWLEYNRIALTKSPPDYLIVPTSSSIADHWEPAPFMPDLTAVWLQRYTKELYANNEYRLLAPDG
jgi:hypothetical protein